MFNMRSSKVPSKDATLSSSGFQGIHIILWESVECCTMAGKYSLRSVGRPSAVHQSLAKSTKVISNQHCTR